MNAQAPCDCWGTMKITPLKPERIKGRTPGSPKLEVDCHQYEWRPAPELSDDLPDDYCVRLNSTSLRGEGYRFYPDDPHAFALNASLGGLAILNQVKGLTGEQRNSYNLMRLLYQYGPLVREALNRKFRRAVDLMVLGSPRRELGYHHILPASLGCDGSGTGKPWAIARLVEAGQEEGKARNLKKPTEADFIRLGLLAAARLNPIDVSRLAIDEAAGHLRLALFDLGPNDVPVDKKTKEEVIGRFEEALSEHLEDSDADFDRWFYRNRDGIVHLISKRTSEPGPIDRAVVREVLLELVFLALRYTGQCVHIQMLDFLRTIEPPLTEGDKALFEVLYLQQSWLADIPLVVLHRYFAPAREAIEELWADPRNPEKAGVLLRLLQYHGEMVSKRREADRTAKQLGPASARRERQAVASQAALDEPQENLSLNDLGTRLLRDCDARCDCGAALDFCGFDYASASDDAVLLDATCNRCHRKHQRPFSYAETYRAVYATDGESD